MKQAESLRSKRCHGRDRSNSVKNWRWAKADEAFTPGIRSLIFSHASLFFSRQRKGRATETIATALGRAGKYFKI